MRFLAAWHSKAAGGAEWPPLAPAAVHEPCGPPGPRLIHTTAPKGRLGDHRESTQGLCGVPGDNPDTFLAGPDGLRTGCYSQPDGDNRVETTGWSQPSGDNWAETTTAAAWAAHCAVHGGDPNLASGMETLTYDAATHVIDACLRVQRAARPASGAGLKPVCGADGAAAPPRRLTRPPVASRGGGDPPPRPGRSSLTPAGVYRVADMFAGVLGFFPGFELAQGDQPRQARMVLSSEGCSTACLVSTANRHARGVHQLVLDEDNVDYWQVRRPRQPARPPGAGRCPRQIVPVPRLLQRPPAQRTRQQGGPAIDEVADPAPHRRPRVRACARPHGAAIGAP